MKYIILFFSFCFTISINGQVNTKIYYEPIENGYEVYADNEELCPVSLQVSFHLTNLRIAGGNDKTYVVAPNTTKQILTTLTVINQRKPYTFKYTFKSNYGDATRKEYDRDFIYDLPFISGVAYKIGQGYNGTVSHQNENALDFTMPISTEIRAVRSGVVVQIIQNNDRNCAQKECEQYNNFILIHHDDGTFAEYTHIKKNGAMVRKGEKINKGQHIAYSGNVGYSTGPHLHLVIFQQLIEKRKTLRTKFKIDDGSVYHFLKEGVAYGKMY
jgi:murein DD-endopeptidase MepM/ murein hydrolase activator NlpD